MTLKKLLDLIQKNYLFLFNKYKFHVTYQMERSHPAHIRIGLESNIYNIKLLFVHEWGTSLFIGLDDAVFDNDSRWFNCERIIDYILKRPLRWPPLELDKPYEEYLVGELSSNGQEFQKYIEQTLRMFNNKDTIKQWNPDFENYVKEEVGRKLLSSRIDSIGNEKGTLKNADIC